MIRPASGLAVPLCSTFKVRLEGWMASCTTGGARLRAGLPKDWAVGDKTGSGARGTVNDVAILRPPGRPPILVAAYFTGSTASGKDRDAVLAEVGRIVAGGLPGGQVSRLALEKTLGLLAMPAGLLWLFLLGGGALCLLRKQRLPARLFLLAALGYALAGNVYLGSTLMARLEAGVPPVDVAAVAPFDAVFVLGGGSQQDPSGHPQANLSGDRVVLAARLWHAGKARVLVAGGMSRDSLGAPRNLGEETRALWRGLGVPEAAICVMDEPCWNTRDEILADRRLQLWYGWKRVGLVSSAWHLPRALGLARRAGLDAAPLGADWRGRPHPFQLQLLVPQAEGFWDVQRACWEFLGRRLER